MSIFLYHGSMYHTKLLRPGFDFSKVLVEWDETEDNTFLYATLNREQALLLGFFSGVEKLFGAVACHYKEKSIDLGFENKVGELKTFNVYLYTCKFNKDWSKVDNAVNSLQNEYKTQKRITPVKIEKIDILSWLSENNFSINSFIVN